MRKYLFIVLLVGFGSAQHIIYLENGKMINGAAIIPKNVEQEDFVINTKDGFKKKIQLADIKRIVFQAPQSWGFLFAGGWVDLRIEKRKKYGNTWNNGLYFWA